MNADGMVQHKQDSIQQATTWKAEWNSGDGRWQLADGLEQGVTIGFAQESKCGKNGPQLLTEMSVTAFFIVFCKMKCAVARCVRIAHNITVRRS